MNQKHLNVTRKIIFRCDGASLPEIGSGHVIRDIAIADKLVEKNICFPNEISFVMRCHGVFRLGEYLVSKSGYRIERTKDECLEWNSLEESRSIIDLNPHMLIVDRLSTELTWMTSLKSKLQYVITMDDIGEGSVIADLVINSIIYNHPINNKCLHGYDYLVLKPIKELPQKHSSAKVRSIVVSFGGYDHRNLTTFFLDALSTMKFEVKDELLIEILVGVESLQRINEWQVKVNGLSLRGDIKVRLIVRPDDFIERLAFADFAVLSGGLTIFDAVSLGVPAIGLPQYRHQFKTLQKLYDFGALFLGAKGMNLNLDNFRKIFYHVMYSIEARDKKSRIGPNLIDRKGIDRVSDIISDTLDNISICEKSYDNRERFFD